VPSLPFVPTETPVLTSSPERKAPKGSVPLANLKPISTSYGKERRKLKMQRFQLINEFLGFKGEVRDHLCVNCKFWDGRLKLTHRNKAGILTKDKKPTIMNYGTCELLRDNFVFGWNSCYDEPDYNPDFETPPSFGCILWEEREGGLKCHHSTP
jgi:hypothetical protein